MMLKQVCGVGLKKNISTCCHKTLMNPRGQKENEMTFWLFVRKWRCHFSKSRQEKCFCSLMWNLEKSRSPGSEGNAFVVWLQLFRVSVTFCISALHHTQQLCAADTDPITMDFVVLFKCKHALCGTLAHAVNQSAFPAAPQCYDLSQYRYSTCTSVQQWSINNYSND